MAYPVASSYSSTTAAIYGGRKKPVPPWVSTLPLYEWYTLPGTQFSLHPDAPPGSQGAMFFNFCGAALKRAGSEIFVHGGGHNDGWRNEIWGLKLNAASPAWVRRCQSTPQSQIPWASSDPGQSHYSDGRPASRHTYWFIQFVESINKLIFPAAMAVWGNGLGYFQVTDAFDPDTNEYLPAGTYAGGLATGTGSPCWQDRDGNIYIHPNTGVMQKWTPSATADGAPGVVTALGGRGPSIYEQSYGYDRLRNIAFRHGNAAGHPAAWWDHDNGSAYTAITLQGDAAAITAIRANAGNTGRSQIVYDEGLDCFWVWPRGTTDLYRIDIGGTKPNLTFTVQPKQSTAGTVTNGLWNDNASGHSYARFSYVPELRGIVWIERPDKPVRFIRTSN